MNSRLTSALHSLKSNEDSPRWARKEKFVISLPLHDETRLMPSDAIINLSCFMLLMNNPTETMTMTNKPRDNNICKLSVRALISSGEHPEAMQTGSCGRSHNYHIVISLVLLVVLCNSFREAMLLSTEFRAHLSPDDDDNDDDGSTSSSPTRFSINFKLEDTRGVLQRLSQS